MGPSTLTGPVPPGTEPTSPAEPSVARRHLLGCALSLVLVLVVVFAGDPGVHSGSDAGGKAATVAAMAEPGRDGVDLGYWAEVADPDGDLHPFYNTYRTSQGWVQVTSAVQPSLSAVGERTLGSVGSRWLPLLAVPLGALGAAALARACGARTGDLAFWVTAFASPLTFYGADQWEHAPALAAGLWATALLLRRPVGRAVIGLAIVAATAVVLRREVVFLLVAVAVSELVDRDRRAHWRSQWAWVSGGAAAGVGLLLAGQIFDGIVLGSTTASRSATQAGRAGSELGQRFEDAVLTTFSLLGSLDAADVLLSVALVAGTTVAAVGIRTGGRDRVVGGSFVATVAIVGRLATGLSFVPGALAALPVAMMAPLLGRGVGRRLLIAAAVAWVGVVTFQWTGGLAAQWGGRYLLAPAAAWAVVALAEIERRGVDRRALIAVLAPTVLVGGLGLGWHMDRTSGVGASRDAVLALADGEVVISTHPHFGREIATDLADQRWLRADQLEEIGRAFAVVAELAPGERVWLLHPGTCAAPCGRRWAERADADDPVGWSGGPVNEVPWLEGTYVLEAFSPDGSPTS